MVLENYGFYLNSKFYINMKNELQIRNFKPKELKKLKNVKEQAVIVGEATDWRDFILKLAGVRK